MAPTWHEHGTNMGRISHGTNMTRAWHQHGTTWHQHGTTWHQHGTSMAPHGTSAMFCATWPSATFWLQPLLKTKMRVGLRKLVTMSGSQYHTVSAYQAPEFASKLQKVPTERVKLAMLPTPIHKWNLPDIPEKFQLFIKRDDLTGNVLSGNKIRKLEFLLADALTKGCKSVITCGSAQSNHCRATAVAAKELGLDCHLLLRSTKMEKENVDNPGNLLPSLFVGSRIYFIPRNSKYEPDIKQRQEKLAKEIQLSSGSPAYCIPVGGSNSVGVFGYIDAWNELVSQNILETVDDIVIACGSGGSIAGLCIANYLTGQKIRIHAISVCDDKYYFHNHVNEMLVELGLKDVKSEELVEIIDGYKGGGYGKSTKEDHNFIQRIAKSTGIFCDPVYTGKAVKGMVEEMKNKPERFQGNRVMFIHTGGAFSLYDGTIQATLNETFHDVAHTWQHVTDSPQHMFNV